MSLSIVPARILRKRTALKPQGWFRRPINVARFNRIEAKRLWANTGEAGLVFHREGHEPLYVGEYEPSFQWLARKLDLDDRLGEGWLTRAEAGERLSSPLTRAGAGAHLTPPLSA